MNAVFCKSDHFSRLFAIFHCFVVEIVVDVVVIAVVVVINDQVECELRTKIVKNRKVDALIYINKASILRQLSKNAQLNAAHLYGLETVTLVTLNKSQNQSEAGTQTVVYH